MFGATRRAAADLEGRTEPIFLRLRAPSPPGAVLIQELLDTMGATPERPDDPDLLSAPASEMVALTMLRGYAMRLADGPHARPLTDLDPEPQDVMDRLLREAWFTDDAWFAGLFPHGEKVWQLLVRNWTHLINGMLAQNHPAERRFPEQPVSDALRTGYLIASVDRAFDLPPLWKEDLEAMDGAAAVGPDSRPGDSTSVEEGVDGSSADLDDWLSPASQNQLKEIGDTSDRLVELPLSHPAAQELRVRVEALLEAEWSVPKFWAGIVTAYVQSREDVDSQEDEWAFSDALLAGYALRMAEAEAGSARPVPADIGVRLTEATPHQRREVSLRTSADTAASRTPEIVSLEDEAWKEFEYWVWQHGCSRSRGRRREAFAAAGRSELAPLPARVEYDEALKFGYAVRCCEEVAGPIFGDRVS